MCEQQDRGFAIDRGAVRLEAAFLCHTQRCGVVRVNDGGHLVDGETMGSPCEDGGDGFGGVAFAVCGWSKDPTDFGRGEWRVNAAVIVEEA